jgi:hypothetical protein
MLQTKVVEKNPNKHFMFCNLFPKIVPFVRNVDKYGGAGQALDGNIIWLICIACWLTKATDTYSEYLIPFAFPWQQLLCECASVLYLHCLSS